MTITPAELISVQGGVDEGFQRSYQVKMRVIADKQVGPLGVLQASGIPRWGSVYQYYNEFDVWALARTYTPTIRDQIDFNPGDGDGTRRMVLWEVSIGYSTKPANRSSNNPVQNPLQEPPVIGGSFIGGTTYAVRDKDGIPIRNTSGEGIFPRPTVQDNTDSLTYTFNSAVINLRQRAEMKGKVNSTEIWGLEPRQVLLSRWSYQVQYSGNFSYIRNDLEFEISYKSTPILADLCLGTDYADKKGWYLVLPNEGYAPLTAADNIATRKKARDKEDVPLTTPVKLLCNGLANTTASEKFNVYAVEEEIDFHEIIGLRDPLPGPFA